MLQGSTQSFSQFAAAALRALQPGLPDWQLQAKVGYLAGRFAGYGAAAPAARAQLLSELERVAGELEAAAGGGGAPPPPPGPVCVWAWAGAEAASTAARCQLINTPCPPTPP